MVPGIEQTGRPPSYQPWNGDVVQVNYEPNGTKVDVARCRLLINGASVPVPATAITMSRKTETLNWNLRRVLGRGRFRFTVVLVTTEGLRSSWGWSYSF